MSVPQDVIDTAHRLAQLNSEITIHPNVAVVKTERGHRYYNDDAWDNPESPGFLPWSPPPVPRSAIVAVVDPSGNVTYP